MRRAGDLLGRTLATLVSPSPHLPGCPGCPACPSFPGTPGVPGSPRDPLSPVGPVCPTRHRKKIMRAHICLEGNPLWDTGWFDPITENQVPPTRRGTQLGTGLPLPGSPPRTFLSLVSLLALHAAHVHFLHRPWFSREPNIPFIAFEARVSPGA